MLEHYDFIDPSIMTYFQRRLEQAPRDARFALDYVKAHARTPEERQAVCDALIFKTNVLWVQLDALYHAYVSGFPPPGAFVPEERDVTSRQRMLVGAGDAGRVLPRHARLRHDRARQMWILLAPERVLTPDDIAVEVLQHCDGARSVRNIAEVLAQKYAASVDEIEADVAAMLQDLADKGFLSEMHEEPK